MSILVCMTWMSHSIKRTVALLVCAVWFSGPAGALDRERLDELYTQLREATPDTADFIAGQIYEEWTKSGSPAMDLLLRRGNDALEIGDFEAAIEHLTALIDHAPEFAEGYSLRAAAYVNAGYVGPALDDLAMVLTLEPEHFEAMVGLAVILEGIDEPEEALRAYREAAERHPHAPEIQGAIARLAPYFDGEAL